MVETFIGEMLWNSLINQSQVKFKIERSFFGGNGGGVRMVEGGVAKKVYELLFIFI